MNFENFVVEFSTNLKANNKNCIKLLEKNKDLIREHLSEDSNPKTVDSFVNEIKDAILNNKEKFKLFESVLKHNSLHYVYTIFKKSDILIQACRTSKKEAAKWLLTMDISPYVQDKEGMTALMYAAKNKELLFVVKEFGSDLKCCNLEDKDGNNALFHSVNNIMALLQLKNVDINHKNHQNETVLLYCCKNEIYEPVKTLINRQEIDLTIVDNEGKTAPMYLVEKDRDNELNYITLAQKGDAFNFINERGESVLSLLIKRIYGKNSHSFNKDSYAKIAKIFIYLINGNTDFNVVVDEDGNTALMAILIARDLDTFNIVAKYAKNLDFSKKNMNGENATSIFLKIDETFVYEKMVLKNHPSFDYNYIDPLNHNTALILATINNYSLMKDIINSSKSGINDLNSFKENALIISAKINQEDAAKLLLSEGITVNQQDDTGNTALHYAVTRKNVRMVYDLVKNGADINLKNNENESALEMAKSLGDQMMIRAINGSLDSSDLEKLPLSEPTLPSQIKEYLYTHNSNLYVEVEKNEGHEEMKKIYHDYVTKVNEKAKLAEMIEICKYSS